MFLIDRIRKLFGTSRIQSFLLEILAIFIGISGSFLVDEWRQQRQAEAEFERGLAEVYFDAQRNVVTLKRAIFQTNQKVMAIDRLLSDDVEAIPDDVLNGLLVVATTEILARTPMASLQNLEMSPMGMGSDQTLEQVRNSGDSLAQFTSALNTMSARYNEQNALLLESLGILSRPAVYHFDEDLESVLVGSRSEVLDYAAVDARLLEQGYYLVGNRASDDLRSILVLDESRALLRQLLEWAMRANDMQIGLKAGYLDIKQNVYERLPGLRLPVRQLGLLGNATTSGWSVPDAQLLAPEQADGEWWSAELELANGMVKFIANRSYGTSWGTPYTWNKIDPLADPTHYLGDPAVVFPRGVGELDGQNIPVEAGRYRVRFNIRSFEYEFIRL